MAGLLLGELDRWVVSPSYRISIVQLPMTINYNLPVALVGCDLRPCNLM